MSKIPDEEVLPKIFSKYGELIISLSIKEMLSSAEYILLSIEENRCLNISVIVDIIEFDVKFKTCLLTD